MVLSALSCKPSDPSSGGLQKGFILSVEVSGNRVLDAGSVIGVPADNIEISIVFTSEVSPDKDPDATCITFTGGALVPRHGGDGKTIILTPEAKLAYGKTYKLTIAAGPVFGISLAETFSCSITTGYDPSDKFERIPDDELFEKVQKAAFGYFWDHAHPVSGLARERLGSGETVTTGGSGFGIMTVPVGIERGWISRQEGAQRMLTIVKFLQSAERFHGAWPHWMNGSSGKAIAFSTYDDGADLVETAFLVEGLLAVKHYFTGSDAVETEIRSVIDTLWKEVEWNWFRQGGQDVLYWHWSPRHDWKMNMQIRSWNEALIVYILAASSPTFPISKDVYDKGWKGTNAYDYKNPLFFVHYSYMGLDPRKLKDAYADHWAQNCRHVRTNYEYCVNSTKGYGYSSECWGLTASDYYGGYTASCPNKDTGTVAPTAALASFPYAPEEAMAAMKYFYYTLGDKLWGTYGFKDAFALKQSWFADSYIAIDEGPIVVMMENYRTGLLWNCFMQDQDVHAGLTKLGFTWK